ncbi:substrate-binding domain-containing protein [Devosia algicola]|uniref:Substrate-binding domain-containing protein n=1 Tax=Devosia algicola TaxID=3026418 RepID=A0ABY7YQZ0_9HYPH|nr:substrate-binding domain-containing protein [Devosia algicola]WDR03300.1 substrate-binding domain-containing protein [Devosia algicola]
MAKKAASQSLVHRKSGDRVTLRTISDATGLSLSTVSLALRGGVSLKAETKQKVDDAARRLGYIPDRAGVRLRTGKTNVIALVLDSTGNSIDFAGNLIRGIGREISNTRYHLTVVPEFERGSTGTVRYILDHRTADGIIVTHTAKRDPRIEMLLGANFPFVTHGRTEFESPHPFHDFDAEAFVAMAVERLARLGCKNLVLVSGDDGTNNHRNIAGAFRQFLASAGLVGTVVDWGPAGGHAAELRRLGSELAATRPDGILCDTELRAISLLGGLQDGGLTPGSDVHVIYKQTSDIVPTVYPGIDSIEEDVPAAGSKLTRLLMRRIAGELPEALQSLSYPVCRWRQ